MDRFEEVIAHLKAIAKEAEEHEFPPGWKEELFARMEQIRPFAKPDAEPTPTVPYIERNKNWSWAFRVGAAAALVTICLTTYLYVRGNQDGGDTLAVPSDAGVETNDAERALLGGSLVSPNSAGDASGNIIGEIFQGDARPVAPISVPQDEEEQIEDLYAPDPSFIQKDRRSPARLPSREGESRQLQTDR